MMASTPAPEMNDFDWDFMSMGSANGSGFADDFNVSMAEALSG